MAIVAIENKVQSIPSVELMRLLGASSSRGSDNLIGQFGSGFLYSLALLARHGLLERLKVCLGNDVYTFSTVLHEVTDSAKDAVSCWEIVMKKQNGATIPLNIDTRFGELDWHSPELALREFISNAIDGARTFDGTNDSVKINLLPDTQQGRAKTDTIRVFVPTTSNMDSYVRNIYDYFICLRPGYDSEQSILPKFNQGPARIYRKGVFVGEFGDKSLFNYNLNVELKESRNVDSYHAAERACQAIARCADPHIVKTYIEYLTEGNNDCWESTFSTWTMKWCLGHNTESGKNAWATGVQAALGSDTVIVENETTGRMVTAKGRETVKASGDLAEVLKLGGLKSADQVLNHHELNGHDICPPTPTVRRVFENVWKTMTDFQVTAGKKKPDVKCYRQNTVSAGASLGYYRDDTVFIRTDIADDPGHQLLQVIIEEISHHITGAMDCTRDFQDFAFRLVAILMS
jgi:hypothetical protein